MVPQFHQAGKFMEPFRRLIRFLFDIAIRGAASSVLAARGAISEHKRRALMIKNAQQD